MKQFIVHLFVAAVAAPGMWVCPATFLRRTLPTHRG